MRLYGTIFLVITALVAAGFWHFFGRSLQYDIVYDDNYSHSEDLSQSSRVAITAFVAVISAALPTWLVYALKGSYVEG